MAKGGDEGSASRGVAPHKVDYSVDENTERGNWSGRIDFLLSAIGFAVGLGNVWRFPYLCYRNGGGAFLIPYVIMLFCAGLPLFFMELVLGQYSSLGPTGIWKLSPMFKGVGYAMCTISALVCIYYNVIIAYTVFYLFASFNSEVPWKKCCNWWNTPNCTAVHGDVRYDICDDGNSSMASTVTTTVSTVVSNISDSLYGTSPAQEYWDNYVLRRSASIDEPETINWQLCLCLLGSWLLVFVCLSKGVKSTGKVVYFTATFPYVVLTILLVRGATLPGAIDGIKFYIIPDFERLKDAKVWGDAAVQIFYSLGPAWGGLITMASYNRFHNNCYRDAIIVAIINCSTSVYAGFAIFSVIGFMAGQLGKNVADVVDSGPGLAFVAYPEGLARMPISPLWSIAFFFMLITLGLDSQFVMLETGISAVCDEFPNTVRPRKLIATGVICLIGFLLGLSHVTNAGVYWMNLLDWYSASYSILLAALLEVVVVMYVYGGNRFNDDVKAMIGFRPNIYWQVTWRFLSPAVLLFIICFLAVTNSPITYNGERYPQWAEAIGWLLVVSAIAWVPALMIVEFIKQYRRNDGSGWWRPMWQPRDDWGPALPDHRAEREAIAARRSAELTGEVNVAYISTQSISLPTHKSSDNLVK